MRQANETKGIAWPRVFAGLRGIRRADLPREISAGVTLAALVIPLNIGYAQVAGLPPTIGLYAGIVPLIAVALFSSSRHVVGSPDASIAALVGAALLGFAAAGDPLRVQFAMALAIMCGLVFFLFWFFRLAFLVNYLSRAVMVGFISGLGIEVFTNQLRKMLGATVEHGEGLEAYALQIKEAMATSVETEGYFVEVMALIESIPHANLYSVAIGVGTFVIIRILKKRAPMIPGALIALALMTALVAILELDKKGVSVLGELPPGLPTLALPEVALGDYLRLLPAAMAIVAITLCEGLLLVRRYSREYGYKADGNQVLFAYGVSNVAAGFTGALVTGNSPSRSAAMDASGARSQLPSLVAAGVVALVMLFFTDVLASLPQAALAGIVASAVLSLIEISDLKELWQMRRSEFWIALVCLLSVLVLGPLRAVMIAFLLTTIDIVRRTSHPGTWVLKEAQDGSHFVPLDETGDTDSDGLLIYRFGAPLYYANANLFSEEVEQLVESSSDLKWFVLDAEAINDIDMTGSGAMRQALDLLADNGINIAISRASDQFVALLDQYGLLDLVGELHLYPTNRHAVDGIRRNLKLDAAEKPFNEGSSHA